MSQSRLVSHKRLVVAEKMDTIVPLVVLSVLLVHGGLPTAGLPLKTRSRYIVDESSGKRVKLACANWPAHLDTMVAEGLSKQPLDAITKQFGANGFNCVRLTWALYLMTHDDLGSQTVRQSFQSLNLTDDIKGFQTNNPALLDLSLKEAFQKVVASLTKSGVMTILDNHITIPGWCCSDNDGNGFFRDKYFDPNEWVAGLTRMATLFRGNPNVVGMSLRNELRGPKQNLPDWYKYMQQGAEAVHAANPDVLVILSGRNYDADLSFLRNQPVNVSFAGKLVHELHWYSFTDPNKWTLGNPTQECNDFSGSIDSRGGFLLAAGMPLFVSEFGADQRGQDVAGNVYMDCFLVVAAKLDFDWALWAMQGSYYIKQGVVGQEEFYGVLSADWGSIRNATYMKRINAIQQPTTQSNLTKI